MTEIKRKGFILYINKLQSVLPELNNEEAGELLKAMLQYNVEGTIPDGLSKTSKMAISSFLADFDRDFERYKTKVMNSSKTCKNGLKWAQMTIDDRINAVKNEFVRLVPNVQITDFLQYEFSVIHDWFSGKYTPKNWLLLTGCCGTGKTVLAKSICAAYNKANYSDINFQNQSSNWMIKNSLDIVDTVVNDKGNGLYYTIQSYGKLLIDDIGEEPTNQYVYGNRRNAIAEILLYRYDKNLPTIITSSLSMSSDNKKSKMEQRYGTKIYDRLIEKSVIIEFNNNSFRGLQKT